FVQAEDGIRDRNVTGVQTCALPILLGVHIVVDSDVAHIVGGEDLLDIKTGVKLVSAKAGEILRNDDGDVAVAHVIHHLLKGWAIDRKSVVEGSSIDAGGSDGSDSKT